VKAEPSLPPEPGLLLRADPRRNAGVVVALVAVPDEELWQGNPLGRVGALLYNRLLAMRSHYPSPKSFLLPRCRIRNR
jgi:hypothetical protein